MHSHTARCPCRLPGPTDTQAVSAGGVGCAVSMAETRASGVDGTVRDTAWRTTWLSGSPLTNRAFDMATGVGDRLVTEPAQTEEKSFTCQKWPLAQVENDRPPLEERRWSGKERITSSDLDHWKIEDTLLVLLARWVWPVAWLKGGGGGGGGGGKTCKFDLATCN